MLANRKILGAAAFSLALAGGGVAGALLGTPTPSGAQDSADDTTATAPEDAGRRGHGGPGEGLATAAEALGITEDQLRTELEAGTSIAQVAEDQGVDVQDVIDALVAEAATRLETAIDELPDRITDLVNREGLPDHGPGGGPGGPGGHGPGARFLALDTAADVIGTSIEDLRTALQDGQTIAEVAAANDVDVQDVIDALVAEAGTHLDQAVTDGKLTQAEADARKADLEEHITAHVNGEHPDRPDASPGTEDDATDTAS